MSILGVPNSVLAFERQRGNLWYESSRGDLDSSIERPRLEQLNHHVGTRVNIGPFHWDDGGLLYEWYHSIAGLLQGKHQLYKLGGYVLHSINVLIVCLISTLCNGRGSEALSNLMLIFIVSYFLSRELSRPLVQKD